MGTSGCIMCAWLARKTKSPGPGGEGPKPKTLYTLSPDAHPNKLETKNLLAPAQGFFEGLENAINIPLRTQQGVI